TGGARDFTGSASSRPSASEPAVIPSRYRPSRPPTGSAAAAPAGDFGSFGTSGLTTPSTAAASPPGAADLGGASRQRGSSALSGNAQYGGSAYGSSTPLTGRSSSVGAPATSLPDTRVGPRPAPQIDWQALTGSPDPPAPRGATPPATGLGQTGAVPSYRAPASTTTSAIRPPLVRPRPPSPTARQTSTRQDASAGDFGALGGSSGRTASGDATGRAQTPATRPGALSAWASPQPPPSSQTPLGRGGQPTGRVGQPTANRPGQSSGAGLGQAFGAGSAQSGFGQAGAGPNTGSGSGLLGWAASGAGAATPNAGPGRQARGVQTNDFGAGPLATSGRIRGQSAPAKPTARTSRRNERRTSERAPERTGGGHRGDDTVLLRRLAIPEEPRHGPPEDTSDFFRPTTSAQLGQIPASNQLGVPSDEPRPKKRRSFARIFLTSLAILIILAVVAGVGVMVWSNVTGRPIIPQVSASDPLATVEDVSGLAGTTWTIKTGGTARDPLCLTVPGSDPAPARTDKREFASDKDAADTLANWVLTYATAEEATQAYGTFADQAGTCPDNPVNVTSGYAVTGMADQSSAVTALIQGTTNEYHTMLITRTGKAVAVFDLAVPQSRAFMQKLAAAAVASLTRLCANGEQGTCPNSKDQPQVVKQVPTDSSHYGWLYPADLPRVRAGEGTWAAVAPRQVTTSGSLCEAMDLKSVSGAESAQQTTLLLGGDSEAPSAFGLDEVVYTFADADAAKSLASLLTKNISDCPTTTSLAEVAEGDTITGTGESDIAISGNTYTVTQKAGADGDKIFRVAVVTVDTRVAYLLLPVTADYNFTDAQWKAVALRAGERITQMA
ncbi:MAG: hypothetical protein LBR32_10955, partial [Propionibacteriaceae bacterium]|nr:hypothetical protein [Propionibacteriaceae bacterium]